MLAYVLFWGLCGCVSLFKSLSHAEFIYVLRVRD